MDLKEELIERLLGVQTKAAKPHLYQAPAHLHGAAPVAGCLAHRQDLLKEIGEDSEALRSCAMGLRPTADEPRRALPTGSCRARFQLASTAATSTTGSVPTTAPRVLMRKHPGLTIEFDLSCWNSKNLTSLVASVSRFDVIVPSNLMRTTVSRPQLPRPRTGTGEGLRLLPEPGAGNHRQQRPPGGGVAPGTPGQNRKSGNSAAHRRQKALLAPWCPAGWKVGPTCARCSTCERHCAALVRHPNGALAWQEAGRSGLASLVWRQQRSAHRDSGTAPAASIPSTSPSPFTGLPPRPLRPGRHPELWLSTSGTPSSLLKQALPARQIHREVHKSLKPFPNRADFNSMDIATFLAY